MSAFPSNSAIYLRDAANIMNTWSGYFLTATSKIVALRKQALV